MPPNNGVAKAMEANASEGEIKLLMNQQEELISVLSDKLDKFISKVKPIIGLDEDTANGENPKVRNTKTALGLSIDIQNEKLRVLIDKVMINLNNIEL